MRRIPILPVLTNVEKMLKCSLISAKYKNIVHYTSFDCSRFPKLQSVTILVDETQSQSKVAKCLRPAHDLLLHKTLAMFLFFKNRTQARKPAYAPALCCSHYYLLTDMQLAVNILPTSGVRHFSLVGGHKALVFLHANKAENTHLAGRQVCSICTPPHP